MLVGPRSGLELIIWVRMAHRMRRGAGGRLRILDLPLSHQDMDRVQAYLLD